MGLKRAIVVDRDSTLLARLAVELGRSGFAVETLASLVGLTPDLLALSRPSLLVIDAQLPELTPAALLVIARSMKARGATKVIITTDKVTDRQSKLGVDATVERSKLQREGARALGIETQERAPVDVRALIDEVLGLVPAASTQVRHEVALNLFSKSNFCLARPGQDPILFIATPEPPDAGAKVEVELQMLGRHTVVRHGEVVWRRIAGGRVSSGMGVRLEDLDEADHAIIAEFMALREPMLWVG